MGRPSISWLLLGFVLNLGVGCDRSSDSETRLPSFAHESERNAEPRSTNLSPPASADLPSDIPPRSSSDRPFFGEPEETRRRSLANAPIASVQKGRGGRTLAFRITLRDGTQGYFKPEQGFSAAHWYAELASYYLDRQLGFGRVPPAIGRRMPWAALRRAAGRDPRVPEIAIQRDGTVRGAFIWWIPERLVPLRLAPGWENRLRVVRGLAISPYQRPRKWRRGMSGRGPGPAAPPRRSREPDSQRASELSDMILFDYLTTNVDRWGGGFTNVRTRGAEGPLLFFDNGAGFSLGPAARIPLMDARLHALQRFRRSTVQAIRHFDRAEFERRLAADPLSPILNKGQLDQLEERRIHLLAHVDEMVQRHPSRAISW